LSKVELLETRMFPRSRWDEVPDEARRRAEEGALQKEPTPRGIAQHPHTGRWYVLEEGRDGATIVWREEGECEICNDSIDDKILAAARVLVGTPIVSTYMPKLCSDCAEFEEDVH
jgi:hypothetical protein